MPRSTIIFGNGLGMALSPNYFALSAALRDVWSGSANFYPGHKRLVASAIPGLTDDDFPRTEEQLDQLQVAIVASEFLRKFETEEIKWLDESAKDLPEAFRRFLHEVATYFHASGLILPLVFVQALASYVRETKSHVATLNYDNLLYDGLKSQGVLDGYRGTLLDGFHRDGFQNENMTRYSAARHGWYLHLHGSPLFIGNAKVMGEGRRLFEPNESSHIVLTHVKHKPLVIEGSAILSSYWDRFHEALAESGKIFIVGYSGEDTHLNQSIADRANDRPVFIVEWEGSGEPHARRRHWCQILRTAAVQVIALPNILEYTGWRDA